MAAIDIGDGATDRSGGSTFNPASVTGVLNVGNSANGSGLLTSIELWAATNLTECKVGTFYGSDTTWTRRDYEAIGSVTSGSKQTFTGKSCSVVSGDIIGVAADSGSIERDITGYTSILTRTDGASNPFTTEGVASFTSYDGDAISVYATGTTQTVNPTVTTQAATSVTSSGCTGNGTITDVGTSDVTRRGFCYKAGTSGDPTTADSTAYDDGTYSWGVFTKAISGLSAGTGYRVRAYAINSSGTSYGTTVQVTTSGSSGWTTAKLGGIASASIIKVAGISVASVKKVMGVAVQ